MKLSAILLLAGALVLPRPAAPADDPPTPPHEKVEAAAQKAGTDDPQAAPAKRAKASRSKDTGEGANQDQKDEAAEDATQAAPAASEQTTASDPTPTQNRQDSQAPGVQQGVPAGVDSTATAALPMMTVAAGEPVAAANPSTQPARATNQVSTTAAQPPATNSAETVQRTITPQSARSSVMRDVVQRRKHAVSDNPASSAASSPQYTTGQAARLVIGQPRFSSQRGVDVTTTTTSGTTTTTVTYETLQTLIGGVQGVAYANGTLVVADANRQGAAPNNNRVLLYDNIQSWLPGPHDQVLQNGTPCPLCYGAGSKTPPPTNGQPWPGASLVLGQPDFTSNHANQVSTIVYPAAPISGQVMSSPVGVAYNGQMLAVADSANNRVLVWKSLPTTNGQTADYVVGQADFTTYTPGHYGTSGFPVGLCSATSLRSPTAVFLDAHNGLWVADTGNDRVLYYGPITGNGQAATLVLGQSDFNTDKQTQYIPATTASSVLAPTAVWSDGMRFYVADSFENRVLIWRAVPTTNNQAADVVLGQKDFVSNNSNTYSATVDSKGTVIPHSDLCASNGNDTTSEPGTSIPTYPRMCSATLSGPAAVISDGTRLYVADAGNDRVLVWNTIPDSNGVAADAVLGQPSDTVDLSSDSAYPEKVSGTDSFKTPNSLAWDGTNLYVADTFNRRIVVYTPGDFALPLNAVLSAASPHNYARGSVTVAGTTQDGVVATITIGNTTVVDSTGTVITVNYSYNTHASDTLGDVVNGLVSAINSSNNGAGDPYVYAIANLVTNTVILTAKQADEAGNNVTLADSLLPTTATLTLTSSGTALSGGQNASLLAPYELVRISGADGQILVPGIDPGNPPPTQPLNKPLPQQLAGVEVYVDGIQCPLIAVNSTYVVAQLPIELSYALQPDTTPPSPSSTINVVDTLRFPRTGAAILRVQNSDGSVQVSTPVALPVIQQTPTVFNDPNSRPNPGLAFHYSSYATATVSVDGTITAGDVATITVRDRPYNYTVASTDTTATVRDQLIALINGHDPEVRAFPAGAFSRVRLQAIVPGPEGNVIPISAGTNSTATVILTAFNTTLCCANVAGAPLTVDNPAVPGEVISVFATGLGILTAGDQQLMFNGQPFQGSPYNNVTFDGFLAATVGGKTANVLFSGLKVGYVGLYQVDLELNTSLTTDPLTPLTIAQLYQISNIVTIPVAANAPAK